MGGVVNVHGGIDIATIFGNVPKVARGVKNAISLIAFGKNERGAHEADHKHPSEGKDRWRSHSESDVLLEEVVPRKAWL